MQLKKIPAVDFFKSIQKVQQTNGITSSETQSVHLFMPGIGCYQFLRACLFLLGNVESAVLVVHAPGRR